MSNIHSINLAENYSRPEVKEDLWRGFVTNGEKNKFFQTLISAYKGSVTHSSICNSYITMIIGRGLGFFGEDFDSEKNKEVTDIIGPKDSDAMITDSMILGAFAGQVHKQRGDSKQIAKIEHISISKLAPSLRNEKGEITSYWYCYDWEKEYEYPPIEYPAIGYGDGTLPEVFICQPYEVDNPYFSDPKWLAGLQYAQLEEEISNFNITHIKRGLSFGNIVGIPNSDHWDNKAKKAYVEELKKNGSGSSNAGGTNVIFLSGNEPITISSVENNSAHKQWDLLIKECKNQLLTVHKCPSPTLIGMPPSTGFSSGADEMDAMYEALYKHTIIPFQEWIAGCLSDVFKQYNLDYKLQFNSLIDSKEKEDEEKGKEVVKEDEGKEESLSANDLAEFIAKGNDFDESKYNVISDVEVDYEEEKELDFAIKKQNVKETVLSKLTTFLNVKTGTARPNAKSSQDSDDIIIRYKYVGNKNPERPFCKAMMKANKVYRKEDILQLDNKVVNPGFGFGDGSKPYSIWKYKGGGLLSEKFKGGTCKHKWQRVIYLKKGKSVDVNSPLAKIISTSEARRRGYKVPTNESVVSIAPHDIK